MRKLYFTCRNCGHCCKVKSNDDDAILLSKTDVERLSIELNLTKRQFKDKYTFARKGKRYLPKPCVFINDKNLCTVYNIRPRVCEMYPFNRDMSKYLEKDGNLVFQCEKWGEVKTVTNDNIF